VPEEQLKTEEMLKYEEETGKIAVWRGVVTENFKKWQRGEKIYNRDKERIALYISEEEKNHWTDFINRQDNLNLSKLIRNAVTYYIQNHDGTKSFEQLTKISHDLKSPLTIIKGFAELLLNTYHDKMDPGVEERIREIFEKSKLMESMIKDIIDKPPEDSKYDVLIVDDDPPTLDLLLGYFNFKQISCKGLPTGTGLVKELLESHPRVLLLDVILPDLDGFTLCKQIKNDPGLKDIKIIFVTAIPESHVQKKIAECRADGYILKPFNLSSLDVVKKYI